MLLYRSALGYNSNKNVAEHQQCSCNAVNTTTTTIETTVETERDFLHHFSDLLIYRYHSSLIPISPDTVIEFGALHYAGNVRMNVVTIPVLSRDQANFSGKGETF